MCTIDTDMRCGRNGLSGIVTNLMKFNSLDSGTIYIFFNKRRNQVKLLLFEKTATVFITKDFPVALMHCQNLTAAVQ